MKKTVLIIIASLISVLPISASAGTYYASPYKHEIGLNYHWALSGFGKDALYNQRLFDSKTKWVREHFATEVFNVENPEAWYQRYDYVIDQYEKHNVSVLGMLAYGFSKNDFSVSDQEKWLQYIEKVVTRYKGKVDAWEIWNEPDSPDFLWHNSPEEYLKILIPTAKKIKEIDLNAKVVSAGLATPNVDFARVILENAKDEIDIFAVHYYYGEKYAQSGSLSSLEADAEKFTKLVHEKAPNMQIWVTEFGLSTGSPGISDEKQKEYLEKGTELLIQKRFAEKVFVYNFRNYDYNSAYENNFGLVDININPKQAWNWYISIPRGPYDKERFYPAKEQALAESLKTELEYFFGKGMIPLSRENWPTVVQAYLYGGYSVKEIVQAIRFGGKTVHPQFTANAWRNSGDYKAFINNKWTGGPITFAYGARRLKMEDEAMKAKELAELLHQKYPEKVFLLSDWPTLVNAYVYGGYPVDSIAKVYETNWASVSKEIAFSELKK